MKFLKTRLLLSLLILSSMTFTAFKPVSQDIDFRGTWMLDIQKSELGNAPIPKSGKSTVKIFQQEPLLIMENSLIDSLGKGHSVMDTIFFDGKMRSLKVGKGQILQRSIIRQWLTDRKTMILISKFSTNSNGESIEFTGTETWKLDNGGKTLTIINETVLPDRTDRIKLIYIRE